MLTVNARPMTPAERDSLTRTQGSLRAYLGWRGSCVSYFIYLVGGAVVGLLGGTVVLAPFLWLGIRLPFVVVSLLLLAGAIAGFSLGLRSIIKERVDTLSPYGQDIRADLVQDIHCIVADAVAVDPFDEEGTGFFLDVGDGQLLFLQGQYLDDLDEEGRFPTRELFMVRAPHSGDILRLEHLGEVFEPSRSRGYLGEEREEYAPQDGEILPGRLETLDADLHRLAQERSRRQ
jgi:hypothetical protein